MTAAVLHEVMAVPHEKDYAGAALVCGGVDCLLGAAGVEADVYAAWEWPRAGA